MPSLSYQKFIHPMNKTQKLLSDIVVYNKYAKYLPEIKRREDWNEIVQRYLSMMCKRYPTLAGEIVDKGEYIFSKKILPSMRALQFAGAAIEKNESRIYNCSYLPMDHYKAFSELMFLLLGGTGVGYSVQKTHVNKLPEIQKPTQEMKYLIGDNIEGWADAIKQLMKAYFGETKVKPLFDFSDIREKGSRLVTAGGKAPGPDPLKVCLVRIESLLSSKSNGDKLTPVEVHDINCFIADAVLAGGIRRAAMIALFSFDDTDMINCKSGEWWINNPQRARANNSAVILRNRVKEDEFLTLFGKIKDSNAGEPGFYFTNDPEYGTNPCCEIALRPFTFCNLCEINAGTINVNTEVNFKTKNGLDVTAEMHPEFDKKSLLLIRQTDFNERARIAAFFGTLQAGFTNFHYLRPIWKTNTEKDALIGVGITGICNGNLEDINLNETVEIVKQENERVAELIGINSAARTTTVKPSGTASCVVGTSSGIHAWHSKKYIRNMQCAVGDDLYNFFNEHHPELIKIMDQDSTGAVIGIPQIAPTSAIIRDDENVITQAERVKKFNLEWVKAGHKTGPNTNNVSATLNVDADEWLELGEWLWNNKDTYNGMSILPYSGGSYKDTPFEVVDDETFERKLKYIEENEIDLTLIIEEQDNTTQKENLACGGGSSCEII